MDNRRRERKTQNRRYQEAFKVMHEVLIREWDPIGVGHEPGAQDEYDMYIPHLLRMLIEGRDDRAIADHLEHIETAEMGLPTAHPNAERNQRIARRLREVTQPFRRKRA